MALNGLDVDARKIAAEALRELETWPRQQAVKELLKVGTRKLESHTAATGEQLSIFLKVCMDVRDVCVRRRGMNRASPVAQTPTSALVPSPVSTSSSR